MRAWIETDDAGTQFLVRRGTGSVTAVAEVGAGSALVVVEIAVDMSTSPRAIRYTIELRVPDTHPALPDAREAERTGSAVAWSVQWHRHEGVPSDLPITALNLSTDALPRLASLELLGMLVHDLGGELPDDVSAMIEGP